ncbi:MAG: restriction endonuclease subunit S [Treponema sp.]|nr:restriction endonuclease subunit S [Treponema sp.]MCL2250838.1 restriction endonuclease subunit S [Treponema sp.]
MVKGWIKKKLGELGVFSKGSGINRANSNSGNLPCIRYGEIYTTHVNYIKVFKSFISREVAQTAKLLKQGDLLFTGSGETKEEIGKCVAYINDFEAYAGGDIIVLSPYREVDSLFFGFLLNTPNVNKQKANKGQGDAIVHISVKSLADISVILPPLPEQRAIAAALSDTDAYITILEKLITKKRAIKQGAMHELLTGKRRLPGFNGEWKEKQLCEVALDICTGKKNNEDKIINGKYPFFVRSKQVETINNFSYDGEAILIPGEGNIGEIFHYIIGKFDFHQRVYKISDFAPEYCGKYVYYQIKMSFGKHALENTSKATVDSLRLPVFQEYIFLIPPTYEEQNAIVTVLSDMDAEIDALTAKLNKVKNIKQGMMSELLTGRIRLAGDAEQKAKKTSKITEFPIPEQKKKGHNQQIDDAVAFGVIVNRFYNPKYILGRVKIYKLLYLLRRYQEVSVTDFTKKAAGPYKSDARYAGGEKIAQENGYIVETKDKIGFSITKGEKNSIALKYAYDWQWQEAINWLVSKFLYKSRDELETLATVDMAVCELLEEGKTIDLNAVKDVIRSNAEWKPKLSKLHFSDTNIIAAIMWRDELFEKRGVK